MAGGKHTFILRERAGRVELHPVLGLAQRAAEAEVSRLNFKEDGWHYCAFTDLLLSQGEARLYAQARSKGASCEQAMRQVKDART